MDKSKKIKPKYNQVKEIFYKQTVMVVSPFLLTAITITVLGLVMPVFLAGLIALLFGMMAWGGTERYRRALDKQLWVLTMETGQVGLVKHEHD